MQSDIGCFGWEGSVMDRRDALAAVITAAAGGAAAGAAPAPGGSDAKALAWHNEWVGRCLPWPQLAQAVRRRQGEPVPGLQPADLGRVQPASLCGAATPDRSIRSSSAAKVSAAMSLLAA